MLLEDVAASLRETEILAVPWVPAWIAYAVVVADDPDPSRNQARDPLVDIL